MRRAWILLALAGEYLGRIHGEAALQARVADRHGGELRSAPEEFVDDPYLLVGLTRGVYLEGYGAVFTPKSAFRTPWAPILSARPSPRTTSPRFG